MQPNVVERVRVDRRQGLGHAVDERLASDEADLRMTLRLRDQMLGAAESHFETDFRPMWKQRCEIGRCGRRDIDREAWEQGLEQGGLIGAQLVSLAPPVEGAGAGLAI